MRRLALRCAAGAAVLGLLLSGCSEERPASQTLPSTGAEPSEEALPPLGPDDLPMPDEARTQDAAGAEAFVRYYIELINRTSTVMDAEPLREFSQGCDECERIARNTDEAASAGRRYEDGQITIVEIGRPLITGVRAELAMRLNQEEFEVVDQTGARVDGSMAYENISSGVALDWDPNRATWAVTQLTFG